MTYEYVVGDDDAVAARFVPLFLPFTDPIDAQFALSADPVWKLIRPDLSSIAERLLMLELDEVERSSAQVVLREMPMFGEPRPRIPPLQPEEQKLWRALLGHPSIAGSLELVIRDLLLSTGADATPANAESVIDGYRATAKGPEDSLHVALSILRANTIARARGMAVEADIRSELIDLAERAYTDGALPGIVLRHAGAIAEAPRKTPRAAGELPRLAAVLDHLDAHHIDEFTINWVAKYRLLAADNDDDALRARRRHVEQFLQLSRGDDVPFRAMLWAERAVAIAADYGLQDLHDEAVLRMQALSRTDLGWERTTRELSIPVALIRQRERQVARMSSWEQAIAAFLASESPSDSHEANRVQAAGMRSGLLELLSGRSFGSHQLPERTHGPAEEERLAKIVQMNLLRTSIVLRIDLAAIVQRFGVPDEDSIIAFLSAVYGSSPALVRPFAQGLRLHWRGDPSSAARLVIPLIEAGARELLFLMEQPMYRMERGASPGRFPAMDSYLDKLHDVGLDEDWVVALRSTLLSGGMNLRNLLAHGFKLDFTEEQSALVLRLSGLFVAMPVGIDAIVDERVRQPLAHSRKKLRRRIGWAWK